MDRLRDLPVGMEVIDPLREADVRAFSGFEFRLTNSRDMSNAINVDVGPPAFDPKRRRLEADDARQKARARQAISIEVSPS